MSKKYVETSGVEMDQPVQSSPLLPPGEHEVELQAVHDDGARLVVSFKKGDNIHVHSVEKESLETGLKGALGVFNKYKVVVELTDGVCAIAYGNGYNLMQYPERKILLDSPIDPLQAAAYITKNELKLAAPKIVGIEQL